MNIPTCYTEEGDYAQARLLNQEMADNYLAHTVIGDPLADAAIEQLSSYSQKEASRFIRAGMRQDEEEFTQAPPLLRSSSTARTPLPTGSGTSTSAPESACFTVTLDLSWAPWSAALLSKDSPPTLPNHFL